MENCPAILNLNGVSTLNAAGLRSGKLVNGNRLLTRCQNCSTPGGAEVRFVGNVGPGFHEWPRIQNNGVLITRDLDGFQNLSVQRQLNGPSPGCGKERVDSCTKSADADQSNPRK